MLGNSLADIAWQKAGIVKPNSNVFSHVQPNECVPVLQTRCNEKKAYLHFVPKYSSYKWKTHIKTKGGHSNIDQLNASLAIQLSFDWIKHNPAKISNKLITKILNAEINGMCLEIFDEVITGIGLCKWPGRFQCIQHEKIRFYIDGAHTVESMQLCIKWFKDQIKYR